MLPMHYITKNISEKAITCQNPCSFKYKDIPDSNPYSFHDVIIEFSKRKKNHTDFFFSFFLIPTLIMFRAHKD